MSDDLRTARTKRRLRQLVEENPDMRLPTPSQLNVALGGLPIGRPPKADPTRPLTVRLPASKLAKLMVLAELRGLGPGQLAREVLETWLRKRR